MEPRSSAQDVHRCDLCETAIVHSYCDFCHVNLCKPCIGEHITDGYDKHKIVPFQQRKSTLIYPKCRTHPHKNCEFECKNCENILVCSSCISSEQHGGHRFTEVSEIFKTKKETIVKDLKELKNKISPSYEEIALDLENQLANLDRGYEEITTTISKQGEEWHREIDFVINKMKTEINEIKMKHRDNLQKHLDEIRQIQALIKQTLLTLRDIQESTEVSSIIKYSSKIRMYSEHPPKLQILLPKFISKPIDHVKLYNCFGNIAPNQTNTSDRDLLDEPELIATIQTGYVGLWSVTCLKEDMIWASGLYNEIKCFSINGSLLQKIMTKSGGRPNNIAVDRNGELLVTDGKSKTVNKVKNGQIEELIRLQGWMPCQLCVTSNGDFLVTMSSDDNTQSKVVRYLGSTEKQTIQFDDEGHPMFNGTGKTLFITENRNYDICVADSGAGAVVVVNQDGKLRWRYKDHPLVTKVKPFKPCGITADSQSRILTADFDSNCIHILDQDGRFLRYIVECDLKNPFCLCIDNVGNLFVCEYLKGNIKKIRYLK